MPRFEAGRVEKGFLLDEVVEERREEGVETPRIVRNFSSLGGMALGS